MAKWQFYSAQQCLNESPVFDSFTVSVLKLVDFSMIKHFMDFTEVLVDVGLPLCDSSHHIAIIAEYCYPIWVCTCVGLSVCVNPPPPSSPQTAPSSISLTHSLITNVWDVIAWTERGKIMHENMQRNIDLKNSISRDALVPLCDCDVECF